MDGSRERTRQPRKVPEEPVLRVWFCPSGLIGWKDTRVTEMINARLRAMHVSFCSSGTAIRPVAIATHPLCCQHLSSLPRTFSSVAVQQKVCRRKLSSRVSRSRGVVSVEALRNIDYPKAILFDCDGVLVDTEKDGHRIAFNEAFKRKSGLSLVNVRLFQSYYSMPTKRFRTCQNLLRLCYCVR
jgi:hypothetical protein